eukprot:tig00000123_g6918.t1
MSAFVAALPTVSRAQAGVVGHVSRIASASASKTAARAQSIRSTFTATPVRPAVSFFATRSLKVKTVPVAHKAAFTTRAEAGKIGSARASHILVDDEKFADELLAKVNGGANFADLAKEHSKCPSGKQQGGDLSWFGPNMMVKEFEDVSFEPSNMGKTVKVKTQFGWHLVQVTGQRPAPGKVEVEELAKIMKERKDEVQLIDVREDDELAIASVPGFMPFPLTQAQSWAPALQAGERLDKTKETYVMCHKGMRSAQMCNFLAQIGFEKVYNVTGGIDAYSKKVDSSVPTY